MKGAVFALAIDRWRGKQSRLPSPDDKRGCSCQHRPNRESILQPSHDIGRRQLRAQGPPSPLSTASEPGHQAQRRVIPRDQSILTEQTTLTNTGQRGE